MAQQSKVFSKAFSSILALVVNAPFTISAWQTVSGASCPMLPRGSGIPQDLLGCYWAILFVLFSLAAYRNSVIPRQERRTWLISFLLFLPIAGVAFLYRIYWQEPIEHRKLE
jgi:hypothetical protein